MRIIHVEEILAKSGKDGHSKTILNTLVGRTLGEVSTEELLAARNAATTDTDYAGAEITMPALREVHAEDEEE